MRSRTFWTKFNSEPLLFETFCDVMRILGSVQPKSEISPLFYTADTSNSTDASMRIVSK